MFVATDPWLIALTAALLWAFYFACLLSDRRTATRRAGPRRDPMPSLASGTPDGAAHPPRRPIVCCGLCGGNHDYDDCPLNVDE